MSTNRAKNDGDEKANRAPNGCNGIGNSEDKHVAPCALLLHCHVGLCNGWLPSTEHCDAHANKPDANDKCGVLRVIANHIGECSRNDSHNEEKANETTGDCNANAKTATQRDCW